MQNLVLITGGAKSGKSEFAENLARASRQATIYLATMPQIAADAELAEKIKRHKQRRPAEWKTIEVEWELAKTIEELPQGKAFCLLDCLSLFVSNLLNLAEIGKLAGQGLEEAVLKQCRAVLAQMSRREDITFLVVTNEVGQGIVPDNALARKYRDLLGEVNKEFARQADTVWLCCVGLPIKIKPDRA